MNKNITAIFLLVLLCLAPFLVRPLFVDDHAHFEQGLDLATHLSVPYKNNPDHVGWAFQMDPTEANPALYFYLVAFISSLLGPEEWKTHLVFLLFHFWGLFCFFQLASRTVKHPFFATAVWLFMPHYWVTANSLLLDGLLAPFMMIALYYWIHGWEAHNLSKLLIGAVFLGLAPLIKYTGILVWALALLWTVLIPKRNFKVGWLFLILPLLLMGGWLGWTAQLYGEPHLTAVAQGSMGFPTFQKGVGLLTFLSGSTPVLILPLALLIIGKTKKYRLEIIGLFVCGVIVGLLQDQKTLVGFQIGLWVGTSLAWGGVMILSRFHQNRSLLFYLSWVLMGSVGLVLARDWFCVRYFVIIGAPLVLLTCKWVENIGFRFSRQKQIILAAPFFVLGLMLSLVDTQHARVYKKAAQDSEQWRQMNNIDVLYYPAESLTSFGWYLNPRHWKPMASSAVTQKNDVVALPVRTSTVAFLPKFHRPQPLEQFVYQTWVPLRTLDAYSSCGFYGSIWGPLPFSFSTAPLEVIILTQDISTGS